MIKTEEMFKQCVTPNEEVRRMCNEQFKKGYDLAIDQFLFQIKSKQQTMYLQKYIDLRDIEDIAEYLKEQRYNCYR